MCGIFGYFDRQGQSISNDTLYAMSLSIAHRGPDDDGVFAAEGLAIGNRRLSIIDVASGHQPFISDDGNIVVVQNGEIFNHIELAEELRGTEFACRTNSDTEVLLRLYERYGIDFVSKLNGMFAIAIYDRRQHATYLVRDRIGVKPFFIHDDGKRAIFASEIKALLPALQRRDIDYDALSHFLTFNYVPRPFTMFSGVRHVEPGTWVKIDRDGTTSHKWWNLADISPEHKSEEAWIEEINATLDDAVRIRLRADVPFGAFLSGGIDSSTIVGLMSRHLSEPVQTFSIGFDDPRYDETPFAQSAADRFGTQHNSQRVSLNMLDLWPMATYHCDQPHGDVSFLPTYRVAEMAASQVKMVLTGDGGDELFAGYDKHRDFFAKDVSALSRDEFERTYLANISLFNAEQKAKLYAKSSVDEGGSASIVSELFQEVQHWDRINQALYIDMQLLLSGNNLVKPDRMGMAVSLEARTPFLDYRMMELAFRMPGDLKLKGGETKYILKKAVEPLIGKELTYRKKQMFTVPVGDWFRNDLQDYCRDHVGPSSYFRQAGVLSGEGEKLLNSHIDGSQNNTRELRALIALDHWADAFMAPK